MTPSRSGVLSVAVAIAVAIAVALSGCSALGGAGGTTTTATPNRQQQQQQTIARAQALHEYPSPQPPSQTATSAAPNPTAAIWAFATVYINWQADTVSATMQSLAAQSVGQARSAMQLAAAQTARDSELKHGGIANSGMVEAISPLLGHRGQFVVVTRERTTATATTAYEGLRPAWHVALATAVELSTGRWAVSRWQPEN